MLLECSVSGEPSVASPSTSPTYSADEDIDSIVEPSSGTAQYIKHADIFSLALSLLPQGAIAERLVRRIHYLCSTNVEVIKEHVSHLSLAN